MDLMDELKKRSVYVDKGIEELLPISHPEELYKASRYLPDAGGKRLRPAVLMLSTEAVGGDPMSVIPAAVALELVHNFTLVHDDIMDNDDVRRGMPAVHVKWGSEGAILAGDTLYSKAFEILSVMEKDPGSILKCVALLSKTCTEICEGQWLDIDFEKRDIVSEEEYLEMVEKKTSVLYGAAAKVGALLGGASDEVADAMYEFGRLVGISFQIQDDVIDMVTPEDILGKVRGSDLIEGKRTLIAIHALNHGVELEIFGKGGSVSPEQIDEAVSILEDSGSIKYAQDLSTETLERGKRMLDILGDSEAKNILLAVADYMVTRNY
ncbi:polyprenyl synthetase family protein [Methanococcoides alaskense]|uniref:Geranylgeranyl diphosphate synthase type I n=1 Tax=Methanococcoides alaskense TaxID=325778 RepID=A0AA90TZJ3_9EURY|nr:polyprenyl synthetase family protein [Methanococcoides alaskense]MDR6222776.1 geranylgeranyl diphosphate synthase type I [Methanococcoides alaskense]